MPKSIPARMVVAAIVLVTIVSGVVQGTLRGRWGPPEDLRRAGQTLAHLPTSIGDWETQSEEPIEEVVATMLRCTGSIFRTYVHRTSGQSVRVALVVGPPGPISVHTPEICFSSQDYTQQTERQRVPVRAADGSRDGQFWALSFRPNNLNGVPLRVYYAWSADGLAWQAAENPRFSLSGRKVLYKIQLAGTVPRWQGTSAADGDPCKNFLEPFLAVANPFGDVE